MDYNDLLNDVLHSDTHLPTVLIKEIIKYAQPNKYESMCYMCKCVKRSKTLTHCVCCNLNGCSECIPIDLPQNNNMKGLVLDRLLERDSYDMSIFISSIIEKSYNPKLHTHDKSRYQENIYLHFRPVGNGSTMCDFIFIFQNILFLFFSTASL